MFVGPLFTREAMVSPRRQRHYLLRAIYGTSLLLLMCTAWMVLAGTQTIRTVGDMARFGSILFQILAPLQLVVMLFTSAIQSASAITVEKDKQTLILLLMTRITNSELVLGKLLASLLNMAVMLMTSLPIFMLVVLFGGTSFEQVGWTFAVTFATTFAAGSLGSTMAFWREKTFQTLALVALAMVFWVGLSEGIGAWNGSLWGITGEQISQAMSPLQAISATSNPAVAAHWQTEVLPYLVVMSALVCLLNGLAIARVRVWNPSRDVRVGQDSPESAGPQHSVPATDESHRDGHVDARVRSANQNSRTVWNNPVLWREICTWAYGRKIVFVRVAYWLLAFTVFYTIATLLQSGGQSAYQVQAAISLSPAAKVLGPFFLLSLIMINALGVTAISNERDGRALDLILVSDLSPKEFLFGKLGGVLAVTADAVLLPIAMCFYLCWNGAISLENLAYLSTGLVVLDVFVAMLGLHCGMIYANSRQSISVSLGTVFFLFLGIVTSMVMMVYFSGNVEAQITPFLAAIVGGGMGLYVALGARSPSPALVIASGLLPLAMFFSITSLLLGRYLSVWLVIAFTYGFTTTAMIMPALGEFNISMGRAKSTEHE